MTRAGVGMRCGVVWGTVNGELSGASQSLGSLKRGAPLPAWLAALDVELIQPPLSTGS
jgi:hypothetical protein